VNVAPVREPCFRAKNKTFKGLKSDLVAFLDLLPDLNGIAGAKVDFLAFLYVYWGYFDIGYVHNSLNNLT
jgi:hypothetical protein